MNNLKNELYSYFNNFSKNLKKEREQKNLTQKQLASSIGITTQSYQAYEAGLTLPTTENLLKLSLILDISLDELFEIKK